MRGITQSVCIWLMAAMTLGTSASAQVRPQTLVARATADSTLARSLLARLVAINTTASTGATTPAVQMLAARFRSAGFPASDVMIVGPTANEKNLLVRWRGRSAGKPVVFNAHLDVVEAPKLDWSSDPFVLTERDGYLYGRGVLDDKGPAAAIAAAFINAKKSGVTPEHDVVLALTSGEETGESNGVEWLLAHHRDLMDAELVLNLDSGGGEFDDGAIVAFSLQAAEKVYMDVELVARGPGGHSSIPDGKTPIDALARALSRLGEYQFPVQVNAVVREFFRQRAMLTTGAMSVAMAALAHEPDDLGAQSVLLRDPPTNALLRTTCIATMLRGGSAPNAIPQEVAATVNCRILPGESPDSVVAMLSKAIADSSVSIRVITPGLPSPPSVVSERILSIVAYALRAVSPGIPIIPYMESGATDAIYFRSADIPAFGVSGMFVTDEDIARMHGRDERISVASFDGMARYSEALLRGVAKPFEMGRP